MSRLIIADSETCADQLYATGGFFVPDPFIFIEDEAGRRLIVLSDLEIGRGRRLARADEVLALGEIEDALKAGRPALAPKPDLAEVAAHVLRQRNISTVTVPADFPLGLARRLEGLGVRAEAADGPFWPGRERKTAEEVGHLRAALRLTEAGLRRGMTVLREAVARPDGGLEFDGEALTSERLRFEIDAAIMRLGGQPRNTIVAGGEQACDPHERGGGPLQAGELIVLDIFPRDPRTGYYGDMTRTVVKGKASEARRRMWEICLEGQWRGIAGICAGVVGRTLQDEVKSFFTASGYPTGQRDGVWSGFFHGLGHGLGLDLHDRPRIAETVFAPGQVVTVEPGLYYPGVGGVRHEDVVVVTETGCEVLSDFPMFLEIA